MGTNFELKRINYVPQFLYKDKGDKKYYIGSKIENFILKKQLNDDKYANINLIQSRITKKLYIMKEIKPSQINSIKNIIQLLEKLYHNNIMSYYISFGKKKPFYLVNEYIKNNYNNNINKSLLDLNEEIKEKNQQYINEKVIWEYLIQSLSGLLYLHENKIYIRDIRPENLLIDENENLKISNFELCAIKSENEDDFKTDIYRLGSAFFFYNV